MANALGRSLYFHHASAFGVAGQIDRPVQQTISTQAAVSLAPSGGHGTHRVENIETPGILSCSSSYVKVGGSFDQDNTTYATYASSVIEDLNICGMITADRVVSRLNIYSQLPDDPKKPQPQPNFSIVGSYFQNLRIAGHKIDIQLPAQPFNNETYNDCHGGNRGKGKTHHYRPWMIGSHVTDQLDRNGDFKDKKLKTRLEHNAKVLSSLGGRFRIWEEDPADHNGPYWCSAVDHAQLEKKITGSSLINFGGIVCVPRVGVIYLAELMIDRNYRQLTMIRVHMCSTMGGNIDGGGSSGGGGTMPPH